MIAGDPSRRRSARWWLAAFFVLVLLLMQLHGPRGGGDDDARYTAVLANGSLWPWLAERYTTWSGRALIDAVTVVLIRHVWLWRLLNAVLATLLVWLVARHLGRSRDAAVLQFLVLGFFLLDAEVLRQGAWWMSNSFNYLWPLALGLLAVLPFVQPGAATALWAATVPAAAYAASQEQSGLFLLGAQLLLGWGLWRRRQWQWGHALQLAVSLAAFAVVLLSPGSAARYRVHVTHWFPEYGLLGLDERLFSGAQLALGHAFGTGHSMGWLFCVLLLAAVIVRRADVASRAIAAFPLAVTLLPFTLHHAAAARGMLRFSAGQDGSAWRSFWIGDVGNAGEPGLYLLFMLQLAAAVCVASSLWAVFAQEDEAGGRRAAAAAVLVWLGSLAVTSLVGLSPSLYLSGQRIYLFQDVAMLALAAALHARWDSEPARRFLLWVMAPLAALGVMASV